MSHSIDKRNWLSYNDLMLQKPIYVRAIFFDAAGTLLRVRGSVGRIYWELARPHGVQAAPEQIERAFQEVFETSPPPAFPGLQPGLIRRAEKQWWYDVVSRVFHKVGGVERFDEYFERVFGFFASSGGWELYPETEKVLAALKDRGLTVGIISNFDSRIYPVLSQLGIFKLIDSVHLSSLTGVAKPDAAIFKKALDEHALHPKEALHVGDSLKEDIEGAQAAGLWTIYLNRNGLPGPERVPTISTLSELLPVIQKL
jgi:putative hydrolase of the HAD superfamily